MNGICGNGNKIEGKTKYIPNRSKKSDKKWFKRKEDKQNV